MSNPYNHEKGYEQPVVWLVVYWEQDEDEAWEMYRAPVVAYSQEEAFKAAEKAGLNTGHPNERDAVGEPIQLIASSPDPALFGRKVRKRIKKGRSLAR